MASPILATSELEDTPEYRALSVLRAANTALQMRSQLAGQAGVTFEGQRDLYRALGYKRVLLPRDYRARYMRNAVAGRIVEAMPKACWRSGGEVVEDEDPNNITEFEQAFLDLNRRLRIWPTFQRADILAGIGRYAIIVIGAGGNINEPITRLPPDGIKYLSPFSEEDAMVSEFDTDIASPRFGLPTQYILRRTIVTNTLIQPPTVMPGRPIHWSRVIHMADGLLDDNVYGIPRLERVWNLLDDLEKVTGGGAEAFWKRADAGMQLKLDPMLKADAKDLEEVKNQIAEYTDGLRRVLTTRGVDINPLSSNVANFDSPVDAILKQISAGAAIPQRILVGSERGELASSQDADAWSERVSDRRNDWATPMIVRPFVDRMILWGVLPTPKQDYDVRWPEIQNQNEASRVLLASSWADLNSKFGGTVVTAAEVREMLGRAPLSEEEIKKNTPADPNAPPPEDPAVTAADEAQAAEDARIAAEDARIAAADGRAASTSTDLQEAVKALHAAAERPINVTVNVPSTLKKKSVVRTRTGFEIQEEEISR